MNEAEQARRILLVEDEAALRQVLCFFLTQQGFEVQTVSNDLEAIQTIPRFQPHLIILDLIMKPGSGWEVLQWLRRQQLTPQLPVLVISALVHLSEQLQGFEEGAIEYLTKPTQPSIIVERVQTLLALNVEQRIALQHQRLVEQRQTVKRLHAAQPDEFVY
ncbi:response regulator transcription factor [Tengunoibacter tsumagoiensis]|uniref:Response regulatory domain-containing protein n=1 Tax=Tengunoibacter tsumagoiensis TaxID=2014871 RepID=A0A401ZX87_9CHLR|nr:response regulator [Tengunoibacter tsumagoiensis]GCE11455.1 hypothetical protein KTT_13140 [Tengunoibacter tsumagoiensis]